MRCNLGWLAVLSWALAIPAAAVAQAQSEQSGQGQGILDRLEQFGSRVFGTRQTEGRTSNSSNATRTKPKAAVPAENQASSVGQYSAEETKSLDRAPATSPAPAAPRPSFLPTMPWSAKEPESASTKSAAGHLASGKREPTLAPSKPGRSLRPSRSSEETLSTRIVSEPAVSGRSVSSPASVSAAAASSGLPLSGPTAGTVRDLTPRPADMAIESPDVRRPTEAKLIGPTNLTPSLNGPAIDDPRAPAADSPVFARPSPVLAVETIGPQRIPVGKESSYEIVVQNSGQVAAEQVVVTVDVPPWAQVAGAEPSLGSAAADRTADSPNAFRWKLGRLEAKGRERLVLRIVPKESRPFDLIVKWDCTPSTSQAKIEVQEPKLAISLRGPRDVVLGKGEVFKLEVANTGNGDAENVVLSLAPGEKQKPVVHQLGSIAVGQKKTLDVELTGRQPGKLLLLAEARAGSGAPARMSEEIMVRRAALAIEVEAPKVQYVGTEATYRIRLSNTGTAPAVRPTVIATLPAKVKYVSSTQNGKLASDGTRVTWTLDELAPNTDITLGLTAAANEAGSNRLEVQCAAEGNLAATASAATLVEAMANVVLTVDDPQGPVAVDSTANYQFIVENRGTAAAEAVEAVIYFSDGLEPVSAEGARNRLAPGQVVFELMPSVQPRQSVTLKVRAKAERAGNHLYRVEVVSKAAGTRVVREGTTRFFGEASSPRAVAQPQSVPSNTSPRTAERTR